jgi:hypothetical protein
MNDYVMLTCGLVIRGLLRRARLGQARQTLKSYDINSKKRFLSCWKYRKGWDKDERKETF